MYFSRLVLFIICISLMACSPLRRGMDGTHLVSSGQPAFSATSTLPLIGAGYFSTFIETDATFPIAPIWLSLYGADDLQSPMSIIALSIVPNSYWLWDWARLSPPDSPVLMQTTFDETKFNGTTYKLNGAKDSFTLRLTDKENAAKVNWLVQRYSALFDFRQEKLILEYREPCPPSFLEYTNIPENEPELKAFVKRAKNAFNVTFSTLPEETKQTISEQNTITINTQYLGKFIGSLTRIDPFRGRP